MKSTYSKQDSYIIIFRLPLISTVHSVIVRNIASLNPTCRIWGYHSGGHEQFYNLGYIVQWKVTDVSVEYVASTFGLEY
jgi:hypothetical protein